MHLELSGIRCLIGCGILLMFKRKQDLADYHQKRKEAEVHLTPALESMEVPKPEPEEEEEEEEEEDDEEEDDEDEEDHEEEEEQEQEDKDKDQEQEEEEEAEVEGRETHDVRSSGEEILDVEVPRTQRIRRMTATQKRKSSQNFYNFSQVVEKKSRDSEMHPALLVVTVGAFLVGNLLGSLLFAPLADKYGRKRALLVDDLVSIASTTILAVSKYYNVHGFYALALFLIGTCTGVFFCAIPIYLGEISPANLRGGLTSVAFLFIGIGMLLCQVLGGRGALGNSKGLPFLMSIPGILASFQLFLLLPFPESPRYLLIQKRNEEGARQALQKLRGQDDVEDEIEDLRQEDAYEKKEKGMTVLKLLRSTHLRWQLVCVFALLVAQQFSGVNAAYYYSDEIFKSMDISEQNRRYASALLTFLSLLVHGLSVYLVDTWGRRPLLLCGVGACIVACVLITMSLELQAVVCWMTYVTCFLQFVFICGIACGPNSIPYLMLTELFLQSSRASAYAVGGFCQWFLILFVGFSFALIQKHISSYSFFIFLPFSIGSFYFILKVVPETKRKGFLEIRKLLEIYLATKQKPAAKKKPQRHSSRMRSITGRTPHGSLPSVWYPRRSLMS
ncbi:hypothetical protein lerEdw1_009201 [Lerista edwardsae]|nr:hypothetical protein lerEdw1_009201 [Lerista edwardsae]